MKNKNFGKSVLDSGPLAGNHFEGSGGGNSGAVISPAPGLGFSAYQDPTVPVGPLPKKQGGS